MTADTDASRRDLMDWLLSQQDEKYRDFQAKLIPTIPKNYI